MRKEIKKVIKEFSESGQKTVYLVEHEDYGRCIYKIIKNKTGFERAERECKWQIKNESEYFPKNLEYIKEENTFVLYEEYIDAPTLEECKDKFYKNEKLVINFFDQMLNGLELLWNGDNIHRDLKPANIMVRENCKPVILDLGIAKFSSLPTLTSPDFIPHTKIYAAPEQLEGARALQNFKIDLFSLGIIMAELYMGRHPFAKEKYKESDDEYKYYEYCESIAENIKTGNLYLDDDISEQLKKLLKKLLSKKQNQRYRRIEDIKEYLKSNWGGLS